MPSLWVMVGPVDHAALPVRFELAVEFDRVAPFDADNPRGEVYVVSDEHGLAGRQLEV